MYATTYHRPETLAEAVRLIGTLEDAKLLSGGQTLISTMKQRLAAPANLIDLGRIAELQGIREEGAGLTIGAGTKHADVATNALVKAKLPALASLAHGIGDPHVRNMGTLGGSIANNDPAADYPAAVLGLGAWVRTSRREFKAEDFFTGLFETALADDEIVREVHFPLPRRAAYAKFPNPASRYAIVGAFVAEMVDGTVRVAITGAGPGVFRSAAHEAALKGNLTPAAIAAVKSSADNLNSDMHASADYRAALVDVMIERAVAALA